MKTLDLEESIVFISEIKSPDDLANSTHILTDALLHGMIDCGQKVVFVAISQLQENVERTFEYYNQIVETVPVLSKVGKVSNKYHHLLKIFSIFFFRKKYGVFKAFSIKGRPKNIICHSPSCESIAVAFELRKIFKGVPFFEFWSDPITLSGINPGKTGIKRIPFYVLESMMLKKCDRVIYGTKTLMIFQKRLFKSSSPKMHYVDIPYVSGQSTNKLAGTTKLDYKHILYAGNFYKAIRDIEPLIDAIRNTDFKLDIYGDGDVRKSYSNITYHKRVAPKDMALLENKYQTMVCIMNSNCVQIPGKIFYSINKPINIVVLLDGEYKNEMKDYLSSYERFILCDNSRDAITNCLSTLCAPDRFSERLVDQYSPAKVAKDIISGGI